MNFSGKEGHPNIQPSTRPGIEPGTSGLGGRDLNHCANPNHSCYLQMECLEIFVNLKLIDKIKLKVVVVLYCIVLYYCKHGEGTFSK